jgi:hypothetical protein
MFLKVFKTKSNQKFINKLLTDRNVSVNNQKMESVGVILNMNEFSDFEAFRNYFKHLGLQLPKIKVIAFVDDEKKTDQLWDTYFNRKDFGWNGEIKNVDLQEFIKTKFDVLISYHKSNILELNLVTALSNANFKVGLSNNDKRLYDLIMNIQPKEFDVFQLELHKYLTVLNKL